MYYVSCDQSSLTPLIGMDIKGRSIHLDDTKSGDPRNVPLSSKAIQVLENMSHRLDGGKLFSVTQDGLVRGFAKACKLIQDAHPELGDNLTFHDLRHEAASRWAGVLQSHELAKMFGWKTIGMSLQYYHPKVSDLVKKIS